MTDAEIVNAMHACGGSFVQSLAKLYYLADDDNRARIKQAWPEYWIRYSELAALLQAGQILTRSTHAR